MKKTVIVLSCIVAVTLAQYGHEGDRQEHEGHDEHNILDYYAPANYKFMYSIHDSKTQDVKKHEEERKDDHVKGSYMLKEADGTTREVHYTSDKILGFNAYVHRSGHAYHPSTYGSSSGSHHGHDDDKHHGAAYSTSSFSGHF